MTAALVGLHSLYTTYAPVQRADTNKRLRLSACTRFTQHTLLFDLSGYAVSEQCQIFEWRNPDWKTVEEAEPIL
jgi:hypothetical protein